MTISQIKLDVSKIGTMKALSSPQVLHAIVEGCFTEKNRTLWRIDNLQGNIYLLLVSEQMPEFTNLAQQLCASMASCQSKSYDKFLSSIKEGQTFRFRFTGNPVRNVATQKGERGKVIPIHKEEHKKEWLKERSAKNGFAVEYDSIFITESRQQQFSQTSKRNQIRLSCTTFEGVLTVTNKEEFILALSKGIGRGKSYGSGLMTVMVI